MPQAHFDLWKRWLKASHGKSHVAVAKAMGGDFTARAVGLIRVDGKVPKVIQANTLEGMRRAIAAWEGPSGFDEGYWRGRYDEAAGVVIDLAKRMEKTLAAGPPVPSHPSDSVLDTATKRQLDAAQGDGGREENSG